MLHFRFSTTFVIKCINHRFSNMGRGKNTKKLLLRVPEHIGKLSTERKGLREPLIVIQLKF